MFCDAGYQQFLASTGAKLEDQAEKYLQLNNAALEGKPADLVVTTHVCRGNYHSTWASSGGYAPIAPILFAKAHVDGFYLEFDDARSGDFAPLQFVAPGKKAALGLVTTKSPVLEDPGGGKSADCPGSGAGAPGKPVPKPPVRFCLLRDRQQADG